MQDTPAAYVIGVIATVGFWLMGVVLTFWPEQLQHRMIREYRGTFFGPGIARLLSTPTYVIIVRVMGISSLLAAITSTILLALAVLNT